MRLLQYPITSHSDSRVDVGFVGDADTTRLLNEIFRISNKGSVENNDANNLLDVGDLCLG